jgi:hypothetical protein
MMASRGMGDIRASKMPKSKTITRKDGDKVSLYKKGGKVKKFAGEDGSLVDDSENMSTAKMVAKDFQSKGIGKTSVPDQQIEEGLNVTLDPHRLNIKKGSMGGNAAYTKALSKDSFVKLMADADLRRGGSRANKIGAEYTMNFAGGGKVNAAGNYTKPSLRKKIVSQVKAAATHGTGAGQWSARKAQVMAKRYKQAGGGYRD